MKAKNIKKYHIITIGCQMNKSDSERLAGLLREQGLVPAGSIEKAGLVVVNTCGVRQSAEDRVYGLVPRIKKQCPDAEIYIMGCLSERGDVIEKLKGQIKAFVPTAKMLDFFSDSSRKLAAEESACGYLKIQPAYSSRLSAFVPIGNGCNNFCSYCVVPHARGPEAYRDPASIESEVRGLAKNGYKEITLIAQNVNSYSAEDKLGKRCEFPALLRRLDLVDGNFWLRFATSHPKDMSGDLIRTIAAGSKICEHIHLPVQAGSDDILGAMNRKYRAKDYLLLIDKIRQSIPGVSISTDIIVGFPGETRAMFRQTKALCERAEFDQIYIARYSPRPGTAAARLADDVSPEEKAGRDKELTEILKSSALKNNKKYIRQTVEVLVEKKNRRRQWQGRSRTNKTVVITGEAEDLAGSFVRAEITGAREFELAGKIKAPGRSQEPVRGLRSQ